MNEIEIQKQSLNIQEIADSLMICDEESLRTTLKILKAIKRHKKIIEEYWKAPKESTRKAYQEILHKEKEMLEICENSEKLLKDKILNYKQMQEKEQQELIKQAEIERKSQIEKVLNEAMKLKNQGNYKQAEIKFAESEKLKRINLSLNVCSNENKIPTQKRFKCKVTDNQLVPCFFNGVEIREINTKKLLEIRKENPSIKIPGVEFYQEENLIIRSV